MVDICKADAYGSIFLKTRRRGTTLHFSQVKHVENLLRRIKLDFPDYGEGFIYLILREVDFDYIQALQIMKLKPAAYKDLLKCPPSFSLQEVREIIILKQTDLCLSEKDAVTLSNHNSKFTYHDLSEESSERLGLKKNRLDSDKLSDATPRFVHQSSTVTRLSDKSSNSGSIKSVSLWSDTPEGSNTKVLKLKTFPQNISESNVINWSSSVTHMASDEHTCLGYEEHVTSDRRSQESLEDQHTSQAIQAKTLLCKRDFSPVIKNKTGLCDVEDKPEKIGEEKEERNLWSSSSFSSFSSLPPTEIPDAVSPILSNVEKELVEKKKTDTLLGKTLQVDKDFKKESGLKLSLETKKQLKNNNRRKILLLDDALVGDYHETRSESPNKLTRETFVERNNATQSVKSQFSKDSFSTDNKTEKLSFFSLSKTCSPIYPYTNALLNYLLLEKELLKQNLQENIISNTCQQPPYPEFAGFRWWPEKKRYCRYSLGSSYLRPRHRYLLKPKLYNAIYDYQKTAVAWMFELFKMRRGGILADEMGTGKTVQATVFLQGLFTSYLATHAIILMPLTLIDQWKSHLEKWAPKTIVTVYHGSRNERRAALERCFNIPRKSSAVLLTTYETFRSACKDLCQVSVESMDHCNHAETTVTREIRLSGERPCSDADEDEEAWFYERKKEFEQETLSQTRPWDVVILDEAHKIKNSSNKCAQAVRLLKSHLRLLLTGTPVTNSIDELWSLMDCVVPGLLGNHRNFKKEFADAIKMGSTRTASSALVAEKNRLSYELQQLVTPYFLRRTLQETLSEKEFLTKNLKSALTEDSQISNEGLGMPSHESTSIANDFSNKINASILKKSLPTKTDVAVWIRLTPQQHLIYETFLSDREFQNTLHHNKLQNSKGLNSMQAVNILLKICRHPALLLPTTFNAWWRPNVKSNTSFVTCKTDLKDSSYLKETEASDRSHMNRTSSLWYQQVYQLQLETPEDLRLCSSKLMFLYHVLPTFHQCQHRCLVFSQSTKMLDIIQVAVLAPLNMEYLRIDGSVSFDVRTKRIEEFKTSSKISILLMTTKVGGQGLNLTCADRVIIVDPDWTPANDNQAVARIYRLGQTKNVKIYRLLTAGAIEDHAFRLQAFKQGLSKIALECAFQKTYFSGEDMKKIFSLRVDGVCETMEILNSVHPYRHKEQQALEEVVIEDISRNSYDVLAENLLVGLSDYDVLYRELSKSQLYKFSDMINPKQALENAIMRLKQKK